ncbi:MAG: bacterioferritin [Planctomycetota bacterium]
MKGDARIIDALNDLLTAELTAINQYYIHYKMCENWGFKRHADYFRAESIDEMKHSDMLMSRILFLDGIPNVQRYNPVLVGETVREQIELAVAAETQAAKLMNDLIAASRDGGDNGTREMVERMLVDTEEALDWAESQLHQIATIGVENYLAQSIDLSHD